MQYGIIGAMDEEVALLLSKAQVREEKLAGLTFHVGSLNGKNVVIVKSGIGKVSAALAATLLCTHYHCDAVIHTGAAGGLAPALAIGDEIIATEVAYHDVDATGFGYAKGQVPGKSLTFKCDARLVSKALAALNGHKVKSGLVLTGDQFISSAQKVSELRELFPAAVAVEMEGAATGQVCTDCNVPFLVIRAVSDGADDGALSSNLNFERYAGDRSATLVCALLED